MAFWEKPLITWREPREFVELGRIMSGRPVVANCWLVSLTFPLLTLGLLLTLLAFDWLLRGQPVLNVQMVSIAFLLGALGAIALEWLRRRRRHTISIYEDALTRVTRNGIQRFAMADIYGWDLAQPETVAGDLRILALEHKTKGLLFFGLPDSITDAAIIEVFGEFGLKRQTYRLNKRKYWFPEGPLAQRNQGA
ncbi:MAG: hypothetical protein ACFBZ8_00380 [Opitutales bacterium]